MNSGAWSSLVQQQVASTDSGPRPSAAGSIVGGGGGGGGGGSRDAQGAVGFASAPQASPQALFEVPVDRQQLSPEMARRDLLVGRRDLPVLRQPQIATPYPPQSFLPPQGFLPMTSAAVHVTETSSGAFPS